jgi:hypothetical protein
MAASAALPTSAAADETINRVNDSVIRTQQMDYLMRNGGYVLMQDTYADSVGGRNATMVRPAPRQVYVPAYVVERPVSGSPYMSHGTTYVVPETSGYIRY